MHGEFGKTECDDPIVCVEVGDNRCGVRTLLQIFVEIVGQHPFRPEPGCGFTLQAQVVEETALQLGLRHRC
jgi:hypothetical protein